MIYSVRHRTTYRYDSEVDYARCVLRLTPRDLPSQSLLRSAVTIDPRPAEQVAAIDVFGGRILRVAIDRPHRELVIDSDCLVDVHAPPVGDPAASAPWEAVRAEALQAASLEVDAPAHYLYPTRFTPDTPAITDFARQSFTPGRPIVEAAAELMGRLRAGFAYDPEATTVRTSPAEAFEKRRGVCQDFAHVMICGLHGLSLPARYVSGYIRTIPEPGQPRLEGADATHAWVALWCGPQQGWIGFDPTNAMFAENEHIVLGFGRDYQDVAPIDGVLLGSGGQTLKVEVDVIPQDEGNDPVEAGGVQAWSR